MSELTLRLQSAIADRYRIEREIGRGGMAIVLLAHDLQHRRLVAIKVLQPEVAAAIGPQRFLREIDTVAALDHPHVLGLLDSGEAAGLLYYVMPYVAGESLRQRLDRERQLPLDDAVRIAREVSEALAYAHQRGIVHRDIKPENILLDDGHARVADFGVARAVEGAPQERLTTTGVVVGTPDYFSPEQAGGSRAVDGRSDQYSLGCVLYEMLAGQPPFTGPTIESLVHQHLSVAPHPVTAIRSSVPRPVTRALERALSKTPADRFATITEFADALIAPDDGRDGPTAVPRPGRAWQAALAGAGALVALAALASWQGWWPFPARESPRPTRKDWILVAAFDGPPGDSTLALASHDLVSAALDQSRIVASVRREDIRQALRAAGRPVNARLDPDLARELAFRSSVRTVLEGRVGRIGRGYSIIVQLVDADTPRVVLTEQATARSEDDLIRAIDGLSRRLRAGLGESRAALAATRSLRMAATPSFEAYTLYVRSMQEMYGQGSPRRALALLRAAVALDHDFAVAYLNMAIRYNNLGYPDSQLACLREAQRRPDRLSRNQQLWIESLLATDAREQLAIHERQFAEDPSDFMALAMTYDPLRRLGRYEEAIANTRRAMGLSPFEPNAILWMNVAEGLTLLGRFDEARAADRHVLEKGSLYGPLWLALIELAAGNDAVAESVCVVNADDPRVNQSYPGIYHQLLGGVMLHRGEVSTAITTFERVVEESRTANDPVGALTIRRLEVEYSDLTGGIVPLPSDAALRDTSGMAALIRGLRATMAGDLALARRCVRTLASRGHVTPVNAESPDSLLLEARIALLAGRPDRTVTLLRPLAAGNTQWLTWARWTLADAYERLQQPDSAAACLERVPRVPYFLVEEWPFVHHRLALLYARLGRVADAERHLAATERAWTRPDPPIERLLNEARAAVASARAMGQRAPG